MSIRPFPRALLFVFATATALATALPAQNITNDDLLKAVRFRSLGPYRAGSWVTSFAVPEAPLREHLYTFYVGTRNGGVWKTTNNGVAVHPELDAYPTRRTADLAVAPSDANVVWVGTG